MILNILFAGISLTTLANGGRERIEERSASTAEVKYIAGQDGAVLFNVVYNNATGKRFSVIVLDEYGNQLYQHFFTDRKFDKKFKLADPEGTSKLTFVIRNSGDNSVQRFEVDANARLVEDVEVQGASG